MLFLAILFAYMWVGTTFALYAILDKDGEASIWRALEFSLMWFPLMAIGIIRTIYPNKGGNKPK